MENEDLEKQPENQAGNESASKEQPVWFQEFVDHYDVDKPKQGEILKGTVLDIQEESILLDVGLKRDAIIPGGDLEKVDQELRKELAVGDEVNVSVIRTPVGDEDLLVSLSKGLAHKTWQRAEELAQSGDLLELEVIDQNRGGLLIAYENIRGFIPNSHIPSIRRGTGTQKAGEIKAELIGKTLPVKLIEVNRKERRLVFSARVALKGQRLKRLKEIEVGNVLKSRVVNVVDFGVFVDLLGVDGLVHKSEIDWEKVYDPRKLFKVGDEIEVKVVGVDIEKERVSLSRKALIPNPWQLLADKFNVGDLVEGKVVSVLDFGAFIELPEGLHGLVHISEIGYANTEDPGGVVKKGDQVLVKIMAIDPGRERVSLSMRRVPVSEQMNWMMNLGDTAEEDLVEGGDVDQVEDISAVVEEVQEHANQDTMNGDVSDEQDVEGPEDSSKEEQESADKTAADEEKGDEPGGVEGEKTDPDPGEQFEMEVSEDVINEGESNEGKAG